MKTFNRKMFQAFSKTLTQYSVKVDSECYINTKTTVKLSRNESIKYSKIIKKN